MVDCDVNQMIVQHPHTGEVIGFSADVVAVAGNIFRLVHTRAQFFQFRGHGQQDGEGVIPGSYRCSVAVEQIFVQGDDKGDIAVIRLLHIYTADYGLIWNKHAVFRVPFNQVISVDHGAYVHITAAVSPQIGEEVPGQRRCDGYRQFFIIICDLRLFFSNRFFRCFRQSGCNSCQCHHAYEQICQQFFHSIVPLVHL